jgi:formamidopyrimidine-DNA glycosylase
MPELAEVDFYRKVWNAGLGQKIRSVELHSDKRIFRGTDTDSLRHSLPGSMLQSSEARGKQMVFQFSRGLWLGIHLGMTGKLSVQPGGYPPEKHDHLILRQAGQTLVFTDMRQFGRVLFFQGSAEPPWWSSIGPGVLDASFTLPKFREAMARHKKLAIKSALLLQKEFPGVGNWMADEILWRAGLAPMRKCSELSDAEAKAAYRELRAVCKTAMSKVGEALDSLPKGWLFHQRWSGKGVCPIHKEPLARTVIGGRTSAWCRRCQSGCQSAPKAG